MQITANKVVTIDYVLTDDKGEVLDRSDEGNFSYLHGAQNIIPGLENALTGKSTGESLSVSVQPEEGYGVRDEGMQQVISRDMFGPDQEIEAGMQFHAQSPQGETMVITVKQVDGDDITVDGNHPLAGISLNFAVSVIDIRDATQEEMEHGHAHGPDGHHDH